jgi:hypothetical protein
MRPAIGPHGSSLQDWSSGQVSQALRQLSPFTVAACEPLLSPYQAVQDMIFSGQEQLSGTYRASVCDMLHADAECSIQSTLRMSQTMLQPDCFGAIDTCMGSGSGGQGAAAGVGDDPAGTAVRHLCGAVPGDVTGVPGKRAQVALLVYIG